MAWCSGDCVMTDVPLGEFFSKRSSSGLCSLLINDDACINGPLIAFVLPPWFILQTPLSMDDRCLHLSTSCAQIYHRYRWCTAATRGTTTLPKPYQFYARRASRWWQEGFIWLSTLHPIPLIPRFSNRQCHAAWGSWLEQYCGPLQFTLCLGTKSGGSSIRCSRFSTFSLRRLL
jgi:hypothetical protein